MIQSDRIHGDDGIHEDHGCHDSPAGDGGYSTSGRSWQRETGLGQHQWKEWRIAVADDAAADAVRAAARAKHRKPNSRASSRVGHSHSHSCNPFSSNKGIRTTSASSTNNTRSSKRGRAAAGMDATADATAEIGGYGSDGCNTYSGANGCHGNQSKGARLAARASRGLSAGVPAPRVAKVKVHFTPNNGNGGRAFGVMVPCFEQLAAFARNNMHKLKMAKQKKGLRLFVCSGW
jgi:hypothetical protein